MSDQTKDELLQRLTTEAGECLASDLVAHAERGALIFVEADLDFIVAAVAVGSDDAATVKEWIAKGQLRSPSKQAYEELKALPGARFRCVILQPYVLAQKIPQNAS